MTKSFSNFPQLADAVMNDVAERLPSTVRIERGYSNQSCSSYLTVSVDAIDDEGEEEVVSFKLRVSDHSDRYGSDATIRIDGVAEDVTDEDGDFVRVDIAGWKYDELVAAGVSQVSTWLAEVQTA